MGVIGRQKKRDVRLAVICTCLLGTIASAALLWVFVAADKYSDRTRCLANLKLLSGAQGVYANDNNGYYPLTHSWMDAITPYVKDSATYHCPSLPKQSAGKDIYGYSMNIEMTPLIVPPEPDKLPMIFDSILTSRNSSSNLSTLPNPPRHGSHNCVVFADGHAKGLPPGTAGFIRPKKP